MVVNATQQQHQVAAPTYVLIQISLKTLSHHVTEQPMDGMISTHNMKCVFSCKCYKTRLSLFQPWAVDKEVIDAGELNSLNPPKQNGDVTKEQEANEVV